MLYTVLAFLIAIGVLITFHEFGHYAVARLFGVKILRFSIGFGPVLLRRKDKHSTEWALSLVPLGGYVKMLDEAPADADLCVRKTAFNNQSLGRRAAIVAAGPMANFLLAVVIYVFLGLWGVYEPAPITAQPGVDTPAHLAGIQRGDTIIKVNDKAVSSWSQVRWQFTEPMVAGGELKLEVKDEAGTIRQLEMKLQAHNLEPTDSDPMAELGLQLDRPRLTFSQIVAGSPAQDAGLKPDDVVIGIQDVRQPDPQTFVDIVKNHPDQEIGLELLRNDTPVSLKIKAQAINTDDGQRIGQLGVMLYAQYPQVLVRSGLFDSLVQGVQRTFATSLLTVRMMGRMLFGEISLKNISGPITIADYAGQSARLGVAAYLGFLALISISIGVLNLLPVPMLDGGHLLFYLFEALRGGRPLPEHVLEFGHRIGLTLVLTLMLLALFNDFQRLFSL